MEADNSAAPPIPFELLNWLARCFPDRCPAVGTPLEEVNALAGEQRVLKKLRVEYDRQNRNEDDDLPF